MNLAYFHLHARPFRPTPDTLAYYPAATHETALTRLMQAIANDEGIAILTGAPGTGKTLIGHLLLDRLGDLSASFITNCRFGSRSEMLRSLLFDLAQPHVNMSEQELRFAITEYLLGNLAHERRTLLLLDEAQDLTPDLLEELRLMSNLETSQGKSVHIVLIGQPVLLEALHRPELAALQQRIATRLQLEMLSAPEAIAYLKHQVRVAGGEPEQVFSAEALSILAERTAGVPRLLNQAATTCLHLAETAAADAIDAEVALEALATLGFALDGDAETAEVTARLTPADRIGAIPAHVASTAGRTPLYHPGMELNNVRDGGWTGAPTSLELPHSSGYGPASFDDR